jgi:hypothetical protein
MIFGCVIKRTGYAGERTGFSPNSEKSRISVKSNIPPLTNDTQGIISIAKQHLHKFHH